MSIDQGTLTFKSVTVEGRKMTVVASLPNGGPEVVFVLEFVSDDFSGNFSSAQGATGTIAGTRRKI